jgi:hypothetical protein
LHQYVSRKKDEDQLDQSQQQGLGEDHYEMNVNRMEVILIVNTFQPFFVILNSAL